MKIFVKANPNAGCELVEKIDDMHFKVSVNEPPVQGRANRAIVRMLAGYFNVPESKVRMIKGFRERNKIFEIL